MDRSGPPPSQPLPITFPSLVMLISALSSARDDLVVAAALSLQFFACLRASELCQVSESSPYPLVSSIFFQMQGPVPHMVYRVRRSKTSLHGFSVHLGCSGHPVCALCIIHFLLATYPPRSTQSPLFQTSSGLPLTYAYYNAAIKTLASRVGLDPNSVSSHSLRAGAATQAAQVGLQAHEIQRLGRWKSQAFTAYMRPPPETDARFASALASTSHPHYHSSHPPSNSDLGPQGPPPRGLTRP